MKILIIGSTSFKGSKMTKELIELGYNIDILVSSIESVTFDGYKKVIICDRSDENLLKNSIISNKYDFVIDIDTHMRRDIINYLNFSSKENIGRYILCSNTNTLDDLKNKKLE